MGFAMLLVYGLDRFPVKRNVPAHSETVIPLRR